MTPEDHKQVIRRVFAEIVNQANYDLIDELYHPDFVDHDPFPGAPDGLPAAKYSIELLRRAIPDMHVTIEDISAHEDKVVIHNTWRGHHTGRMFGVMPPTGKRVHFTGIVIWRFADGKVAERWAMIDKAALRRQTGAAVPAATTMAAAGRAANGARTLLRSSRRAA